MKKAVIIGGGIAGLAAGVYARQSGFDTVIYEMHSIPGGNSTSWKRNGYFFEGGMHWLVGSGSDTPLHSVWKEVGALSDNNSIYNRDPFLTYMDDKGPVCLYRDPDRLYRELVKISPDDEKAIKELVRDVRAFRKAVMPILDIKGVQVRHKAAPPLSMLFTMPALMKRMKSLDRITAGEYISRFRHPGIRCLLETVVSRRDYTATSTLFTLGGLAAGDCGYPEGGSLRMAGNIADTFTGLGGVIKYNSRVSRVMVEDGRAVGVIVNGERIEAEAVIVTSDTLTAIDHLFAEPLHEDWMDEMREETTPVNCTFVSLGIREDLGSLPENMVYALKEPIRLCGQPVSAIVLNNYASFQGYAPAGCTAVTCALSLEEDTYDEWKAAKEDGTYEQKKKLLAETVIGSLEQLIPGIKGKTEVWDVATPLTYERYCGTFRGSWMSVMKPGYKRRQYPGKAQSVERLYFAGQRIALPGGLPVAVTTGRTAVQLLCRDTESVFQARL